MMVNCSHYFYIFLLAASSASIVTASHLRPRQQQQHHRQHQHRQLYNVPSDYLTTDTSTQCHQLLLQQQGGEGCIVQCKTTTYIRQGEMVLDATIHTSERPCDVNREYEHSPQKPTPSPIISFVSNNNEGQDRYSSTDDNTPRQCQVGPNMLSNNCPGGEYCQLTDGTCNNNEFGKCAPRPDACLDTYNPVCGCDGISYGNECKAREMGASIYRKGGCDDEHISDGHSYDKEEDDDGASWEESYKCASKARWSYHNWQLSSRYVSSSSKESLSSPKSYSSDVGSSREKFSKTAKSSKTSKSSKSSSSNSSSDSSSSISDDGNSDSKSGKKDKRNRLLMQWDHVSAPTICNTQKPTADKKPTRKPTRPATRKPTIEPTRNRATPMPTKPVSQQLTAKPPTPTPTKNPILNLTPPPNTQFTRSPTVVPTNTPTKKLESESIATITEGRLVSSPRCIGGGYTCLQNSDFGVQDSSRYNIDISLEVSSISNTQAYINARSKWMDMIIGDLPSIPRGNINPRRDFCFNDHPVRVDDIYICGKDLSIDGMGGVLGFARPLWARKIGTGKLTTVVGEMAFDIPDIDRMVARGTWEDVILHEMGHVIGIGTLWKTNGLVTQNLEYVGENAINIWTNEWGCRGNAPPLELDGGPGTRGSHWDECLKNEFMTGFVNSPPNPISRLTIASLADIGYTVNYAASDGYDGSDTTCCFSASLVGFKEEEVLDALALSEDGRANAMAYGKELLNKPIAPSAQDGGVESEDGIMYVGSRIVVVLYEEEGRIFEVMVTNNDEDE